MPARPSTCPPVARNTWPPRWRNCGRKNPNHIFVAAGDLIGASPLLSALFHDEPTVEAMGLMGLEASAVGNHEFDHGSGRVAAHAKRWLPSGRWLQGAAAVQGRELQVPGGEHVRHAQRPDDLPELPRQALRGHPGRLHRPDTEGHAQHRRAERRAPDCASTTRPPPSTSWCRELQRQGIEAIVVLIHEGGFPTGDYNECPGISGPIVDIVKKLDKAVDVVVSGHTHRAYNCRIDGRLVTSGDKYGTIVSEIDIVLDPKTRQRDAGPRRQPDRAHRPLQQGPGADTADHDLRTARRAAGQARRRQDRRAADARRKPGRRNAGRPGGGRRAAGGHACRRRWRRADRADESGRPARQPDGRGRRRGALRGPVRGATVLQQPGHALAHRRADRCRCSSNSG